VKKFTPKKFTYVYSNDAGYGNKLYSILSALTVSLITDSATLVDWPSIAKYIDEPLYGFFVANFSAQNELSPFYKRSDVFEFPYKTYNSYKLSKNLNYAFKNVPNNEFERFSMYTIAPYFFELGCNPQYFQKFLDYGLVSKKSIKKARNFLNSKMLMGSDVAIDTVYRVGFELAHSLMTTFWQPKDYLKQIIKRKYEKEFRDYFVIGFQLRSEYLDWRDVEVFIDCAHKIEQNFQSTNQNKTVKWFLSSDSQKMSDKIYSMYKEKFIRANGTIGHVEDDRKGFERAIIDTELLSLCDDFIISGGSTFGLIPSIRSGKYPLYVNGMQNEQKCQRLTLSRPSFYFKNFAIF
jgi:hypothetical protein